MHFAIWTKYISSNIQISFQIFSFRAAASRAEQIYLAFCFCPLFIERQLLPRLSSATSHNLISSQFLMRFGQIYLAIWTNLFGYLDKYIWLSGQICEGKYNAVQLQLGRVYCSRALRSCRKTAPVGDRGSQLEESDHILCGAKHVWHMIIWLCYVKQDVCDPRNVKSDKMWHVMRRPRLAAGGEWWHLTTWRYCADMSPGARCDKWQDVTCVTCHVMSGTHATQMSAAQLDETDQVQIIEREAATHPCETISLLPILNNSR